MKSELRSRKLRMPILPILEADKQQPLDGAAPQADEDSSNNLRRLRSGQQIYVTQLVMPPVKGMFLGLTKGRLCLRGKRRQFAVPLWDVLWVGLRGKANRWKGALNGVGIGTVTGLVVGAIAGTLYHEAGETAAFILACTPAGASVGTALGAVFAPPSYRTFYVASGKRAG